MEELKNDKADFVLFGEILDEMTRDVKDIAKHLGVTDQALRQVKRNDRKGKRLKKDLARFAITQAKSIILKAEKLSLQMGVPA